MWIVILSIIVVLLVILDIFELKTFIIKSYEFTSSKITNDIKIVFLTDLHGNTFKNTLLEKIRSLSPDIIIVGGDLINKHNDESFERMSLFISELSKVAKTIYCFGNHEIRLNTIIDESDIDLNTSFCNYLNTIPKANVISLHNESININNIVIHSLELPIEYYQKRKVIPLSDNWIEDYNCLPIDNNYNILVTHNPSYGDDYKKLGYDLILSGHTHGCLVHLPIIGSVISPELKLFPKYDSGLFTLTDKSTMIISNGLGYHSYPIRFNCRQELVLINLHKE